MKVRRYRAGMLVLLMLALMLAANAAAAPRVQLTAVLCCSKDEISVLQHVFAAYQVENPDIVIDAWQLEGSYNEVMAIRLAGGSAPDLIFGDSAGFARWGAYLLPLDGYVAKLGLARKYANPDLLRLMQFNGTQYGLPFRLGTKVLLYQPDMFLEAGLSEPPAPSQRFTTEDYEKLANRLTVRDANNELLKWGSTKHVIWSVLDEFAVPQDPEYRKAMYNSQPMIDAVQFMVDAIYRWGYANGWAYQGPEWVAAKKVAMVPDTGAYDLPGYRAMGDISWKLTSMPGAPQSIGVSGYAVSATTRHPEEAVALAVYVSTDPKAQEAMASVAIPVTPQGIQYFIKQSPGRGMEAFATAVSNARLEPIHPRALKVDTGKIQSLLWDGIQFGIVEKNLPVRSSLEGLNQQIQAIYDQTK